ncbi:MAG TPA: hypothetical protein VK726_08995 [Acetobacteraceae bacterium]|nr:hypothetical protein [Acetobacteraceae bacterium]
MRLIPPHYITPYVKHGKNDPIHTEAIGEAAGRPDMRFVAVTSVTQQAEGVVPKLCDTLMRQHTQPINTRRGRATEFAVIAAKGTAHVTPLLAAITVDASRTAPSHHGIGI